MAEAAGTAVHTGSTVATATEVCLVQFLLVTACKHCGVNYLLGY